MLKLSPCIEMLYSDLDFVRRIQRVAELRFPAFEFWGWWDKDLDVVEKAAKDAKIAVACVCVKTDFPGGAGLLNPAAKDYLVKAVKDCIPVAKKLGCTTFIVTTGKQLPNIPREDQHKCCVAAVTAAAPVAEDAGITLVLEPLNPLVDHKGYYLTSSAEGFQMVDEIGSSAVKLLFDIYHQQITEGNVTRNICQNINKIGHFHVADNPGRTEPGTGEISYPFILKKIAEAGYQRYIGLEFHASKPEMTDEILKKVQQLA